MKTNQAGINIIKTFESLHDGDLHEIGLQPKLCPAGKWTSGWGRVVIDPLTNKPVTSKKRAYEIYPALTEAQAEIMLQEDLIIREEWLSRWSMESNVPLNQNQFSALISFIYNVGTDAFAGSTLSKKLFVNDYAAAAAQFPRWNKGMVNGVYKTLPGLVKRRAAEQKLFVL